MLLTSVEPFFLIVEVVEQEAAVVAMALTISVQVGASDDGTLINTKVLHSPLIVTVTVIVVA